MHFIRFTILVLALFTFSGHAMAQKTMIIATEGAYPPFNMINSKGELVGFDIDIALALCEVMDMKCTIVTNEWDTILDELVNKKYDAVIASMAKTPERMKVADFTTYYYRSRSTFVGDPNKEFVQTREGVKGMTLGAQAGTVQAQYLRDNFSGSAIIKESNTTNEGFAMLSRGEIDAMLTDSLTIFDFLQTEKGKRYNFIGSPLPASDPSSEARIAVRKGEIDLVEAFNKAIKEIQLNGTYDRINRKYFPFSIY